VPVPREIIPVASVLSTAAHMLIQMALLLAATLVSGLGISAQWLWLPVIWGFGLLFVIGLSLASSALAVYVRDMRYLVESFNLVLFYLVPIFYPLSMIPARFAPVYQLNPVAAMVLAQRNVLMDGVAPPGTLLWKLAASSTLVLVVGYFIFQRLKHRLYEYL
jgi:lipopolysaccharide transport system permease protein